MEEIEKLLQKFETLKNTIGWTAAIVLIVMLVGMIFIWNYLNTKIEKSVEEASDKAIIKFQARIDKENAEHSITFSARHQKQIDAIHDIHIQIQKVFGILELIQNGDKFNDDVDPHKELNDLINYRTYFIEVFRIHKIIISKELCEKIENLIPKIDEFIVTYKSGLFSQDSQLNVTISDSDFAEPHLVIAGVWSHGVLDEIIRSLESIQKEIEDEFRKVNGV